MFECAAQEYVKSKCQAAYLSPIKCRYRIEDEIQINNLSQFYIVSERAKAKVQSSSLNTTLLKKIVHLTFDIKLNWPEGEWHVDNKIKLSHLQKLELLEKMLQTEGIWRCPCKTHSSAEKAKVDYLSTMILQNMTAIIITIFRSFPYTNSLQRAEEVYWI